MFQKIALLLTAFLFSAGVFAQIPDPAPSPAFPFIDEMTEETQLLILGDFHMDAYENTVIYPEVISLLLEQKPSFDCVFLEEPQVFQPQLDAFQAGEMSWENYSSFAQKEIESYYAENQPRYYPILEMPSSLKYILDFFLNKKMAAENAAKNKVPLYALDEIDQIKYSVDARSSLIVNRIASLFQSQKCHFGLLIVGNGHLGTIAKTNALGIRTIGYDYDDEKRVFFKPH